MMAKKRIGEVTIWNTKEDRMATSGEIYDLLNNSQLLIDHWTEERHRTGNAFMFIFPSQAFEVREYMA